MHWLILPLLIQGLRLPHGHQDILHMRIELVLVLSGTGLLLLALLRLIQVLDSYLLLAYSSIYPIHSRTSAGSVRLPDERLCFYQRACRRILMLYGKRALLKEHLSLLLQNVLFYV